MLGTSLSFCVLDIIAGKVDITDVEMIYTGTAFQSKEKAIECYTQHNCYWEDVKEQAEKICNELWESGKIVEFRLQDPRAIPFARQYWYDSLDDLINIQREAGFDSFVNVLLNSKT